MSAHGLWNLIFRHNNNNDNNGNNKGTRMDERMTRLFLSAGIRSKPEQGYVVVLEPLDKSAHFRRIMFGNVGVLEENKSEDY